MIGVSTAQNITNLVPAVQKKWDISHFLLLETSTAAAKKWGDGLTQVLSARGIKVESVSLKGFDSDIQNIAKVVLDKISDISEPIVCNLGGGQKPQQIALWEVFQKRNLELGIQDIVCYANQDNVGELEIWSYRDKILHRNIEPIVVDLRASEIFSVFGYQIRGTPQLIYEAGRTISFQSVPDLLPYQDFRQYMHRMPITSHETRHQPLTFQYLKDVVTKHKAELGQIMSGFGVQLLTELSTKKQQYTNNESFRLTETNRVLKKTLVFHRILELIRNHLPYPMISTKEPALLAYETTGELILNESFLKKLTEGQFNKISFYFEHIVNQRVMNLLLRQTHNFTEAYSNLIIEKEGQVVAEYDLLCVTNRGTIVALDAKTFDFEKKEMDARLYNLEKGSGFYRQFSAVFPYDYDDVEEPWTREMFRIISDVKKKNLGFYVVNDSKVEKFWVRLIDGKIHKRNVEPPADEKDWIMCRPLADFLKS